MKKVLLALTMLILVFSLCACSSDKKDDKKKSEETGKEETKKGDSENKEEDKSDKSQIRKIGEKIAANGDFSDDAVTEIDVEVFEQMLDIDSSKVEESIGYTGSGATTNALYVAKFKEASYLEEVEKAIDVYMKDQIEQCETYNPPEVEKLKASAIYSYPDQAIVVMVISRNSDKVKDILKDLGM